jgi:hypothetical protein
MQPHTISIEQPSLDSSPLVPAANRRPKPCCVTYTLAAWQVYLAMFALLLVPFGCIIYDKLGNVPCKGAPSIYAGCGDTKGHCKHHHFLNYLDDPVAFGCNDTTCFAFQDCQPGSCPSPYNNCGCPVACPGWPPNANASAAERQRSGEACVRKGFGRWVSDEANCTEPHVQQCAPVSSDWSTVDVPSYGGECQGLPQSGHENPECLCTGPYWVAYNHSMAFICLWFIFLCCCCVRDVSRTILR